MNRSWWWKASVVTLLGVMAVIYLIPTVAGDDRLPQWFLRYVPSRLQLGLDLQGGIHLVYDVEVKKAVSDKVDRIAADIEERLKKDKKIKVKVSRIEQSEVRLAFDKPEDLKVVDTDFLKDVTGSLDEVSRDDKAGLITLRMNDDYVQRTQDYAIRQAVETIRGRIDEFGVAEPTILRKGSDIVVELPGLTEKSFERVKRQIGRTAQLEFKILDDSSDIMRKAAARLPADGPISVRTDSYDGKQRGVVSYTYLESGDKEALKKFIGGMTLPEELEVLLGQDNARDEKGDALPEKVWVTYLAKRRSELTGEYISDAEVLWDDRTGRPEVSLTFDRAGATIFERLSGDNIGRRMAIVLDSQVNSAPVLESRIGGGRARITLGGLRSAVEIANEAKDLSGVLRTGALPAPLRKTFERQVGPTLGQDAIEKGKLSFSIGGLAVILFVLYYYRGAGVICTIGLVFNLLFIAAIMAGFGATLTLPGIAGLVLTVGMAVDANVIIYERIREEIATGKSPRSAVDAGYGRAFSTILDAQLTTAIAALVLLQYGTGPIRGFALMLLIGIICSLFTGVVVTRLFFDFVVTKLRPKALSI